MSRVPFNSFNFTVSFDGSEEFGGFSDVSGLGVEITTSEYRDGNDAVNYTRNIPGIHKGTDVTLKRGVVDSSKLAEWFDQIQTVGHAAKKESVVVTLRDDSHQAQQSWTLLGVLPTKYVGPTLAAKGGGDVAMEEVTLKCDSTKIGVT